MFTDKCVTDFVDALASKEPVPGGGSTAALGGSLAAALVSMVCNLTIGKKGYEGVAAPMGEILEQAEALRRELLELLESDTQVYTKVMAAYRRPKKTAQEQQEREAAIQTALQEAAEVPLAIAERCSRVVDLAMPAAEMGNTWAVSDAGVGVLMAEACMHAALLNVSINLASIRDQHYVDGAQARMEAITADKENLKARVLRTIHQKIGA